MRTGALEVRLAEEDDSDHLIAVWRSTWAATYTTTLGGEAVDVMLRDLDENGAANLIPAGAQGLCLVHHGKIVGTAIHSKDGPNVYLWGMYVLPEHQRSGAGTLLLRAVREAAGERPIEVRVLQTSAHANSFYRKHGFRLVGQEATEIMPGVKKVCSVMRQAA